MFDISVESVCHIIAQARALALGADPDGEAHDPDAQGRKELVHGDVDGDDEFLEDDEVVDDALPELTDDHDELLDFIEGLNEDEQIELVVISWIGRGTYTIDEWEDAADTARLEHSANTAEYVLGQPRIADYLEEGLSQLGFSCDA